MIDLDAAMGKGQNRRLVGELCVRAKREFRNESARRWRDPNRARSRKTLVSLGVAQIIIGSAAFANRQIWQLPA